MTPEPPRKPIETSGIETITDPSSLRERDDVQFHEDIETVDEETLETVAELDDMVVVGVTNADDEVLMRRWTADCSWKLPVQDLDECEDYTEAARRAVEVDLGLPITFEGSKGCGGTRWAWSRASGSPRERSLSSVRHQPSVTVSGRAPSRISPRTNDQRPSAGSPSCPPTSRKRPEPDSSSSDPGPLGCTDS